MFDKTNKDSLNAGLAASGEKGKLFSKTSKPKKQAKFKEDTPLKESGSLTFKDTKSQKSALAEPSLKKFESSPAPKSKKDAQEDTNQPETPKASAKLLKSEKSIQQKLKEMKAKKLQKIGETLEYNTAPRGRSFVPTVVLSVKFLAQKVQNSPKNTIKLDLPETLVCDKKIMQILYLFTNTAGYAEVIELNNDLEGGLGDDQMVAMASSLTLSANATAKIIEIGNAWHDQNFAHLKDEQNHRFRDMFIFPVSILKVQADPNATECESKMLYFSSSIIDALLEHHTRHDFVIQRYVICRGMTPSIIRCELKIQRYPNLDFKKLADQRDNEAAREQARKDAEYERQIEMQEAEREFWRTGVRPKLKDRPELDPVEEEKIDISKELTFVDAPDINLKVFKISSRTYFTGEQLQEKVKKLAKNPAFIAGAKDSHLIPQLIQVEGPTVRFDEEFLQYMLDGNSKLKKLFKQRNLTDQERHERYLRKKISGDQDSTASENDDQNDFNHLYNPKAKFLKSKVLSVFFQKINVVNDTEYLRKQHLFKIQQLFQEELNNYQTQMAGQFATQELYYKNSNVIETNSRGGFKSDHQVTRIKDQETEDLRSSIETILKLARKKDKYVNHLVIDFLRESGRLHRNMFLQIKYSNNDEQFAMFDCEKVRPQYELSKRLIENQGDFILNTKPMSQLYESYVKQEKEKQDIIDKQNLEDIKKQMQESNNKKINKNSNDEPQGWNFSIAPTYKEPQTTKSKFQKAQDAQLDKKYITVKDSRGRFHEQKCSGQFCNIKQYDIQQDIPELYVGIIIKMQDDIVQKEQHHRISWTFGAQDDQILPNIGSIDYFVPNTLILLDEDIKAIWSEQIQIQKEIDSVHKEGLSSKVIDEIYSRYKDSFSGMKYMCTTAETKFKRMPVCYNCYKFYFKLGKQIIGYKGQINVNTLWQISDPIFNKDKDKEERYNQIMKFMKQQLEGAVKKNAKEIRQKLLKTKKKSKSKEPPKKSQYKANPYSKLNKNNAATEPPKADDASKGKTLDLKNMVQKVNLAKEQGSDNLKPPSSRCLRNKEVMFKINSARSAAISDQISENLEQPKKRHKINTLLDIIFGDNNDVERPVQPTMPSIYERNKKWKSQGPSTESSQRLTADTKSKMSKRHDNCIDDLQTPSKIKKIDSKKPPKPEINKQYLVPIRQNRPSKGFISHHDRLPLQGFSPFTQERYSQSPQQYPQIYQPLSQSHRQQEKPDQLQKLNPQNLPSTQLLNSLSQDQPSEDLPQNQRQVPKIKVEVSSSTPSKTSKKQDSEIDKYSQEFNQSQQQQYMAQYQSQENQNQSLFNPIHGQMLQALEDQGHPMSIDQLKQELTQLQCLSPQFDIQKVMEDYLSGKSLSEIAKGQQLLLPNQREILKLRQVQKLKDFHRDKISQKSVFLKKSFSLPNLNKEYKFVNQMLDEIPKEMKNSQIEHHLNNEIRTSIKNEQYESKNKVNLFFKRVNNDVLESIIGENSINFNTKAKIAQDTYNSGVPHNKWSDYYKAIKLRKMKIKKQGAKKQKPQWDDGLNKKDIESSSPVRSVSVKDISKPKLEPQAAQVPKRIKIIKVPNYNHMVVKPQRFKDKDLQNQQQADKIEVKSLKRDENKVASQDDQSVKTKETTDGNQTASEKPEKPLNSPQQKPEVQSEQDKLVIDEYKNTNNVQIEVIKHDDLEMSDEILSDSEIAEINMRNSDDLENPNEEQKGHKQIKIEPVKEETIEESLNVQEQTSSLIKDYYNEQPSPKKEIISEEVIDAPSVICPYLDDSEKQVQQIMDGNQSSFYSKATQRQRFSRSEYQEGEIQKLYKQYQDKQISEQSDKSNSEDVKDEKASKLQVVSEEVVDSPSVICPYLDHSSKQLNNGSYPKEEGGEIEKLYKQYQSHMISDISDQSIISGDKMNRKSGQSKQFSLTVNKIKVSGTDSESNNTEKFKSVSHRIIEKVK